MKPDCYKCKHRRNILGDCHSACEHPKSFQMLVAAMAGIDTLPVTCNEHGFKNGWFYWPMNFDPVWLLSCDLFERADEKMCVCGHGEDSHDHEDECHHNDQPSGGTGCLCPKFKEKK